MHPANATLSWFDQWYVSRGVEERSTSDCLFPLELSLVRPAFATSSTTPTPAKLRRCIYCEALRLVDQFTRNSWRISQKNRCFGWTLPPKSSFHPRRRGDLGFAKNSIETTVDVRVIVIRTDCGGKGHHSPLAKVPGLLSTRGAAHRACPRTTGRHSRLLSRGQIEIVGFCWTWILLCFTGTRWP